jgi:hypothetical protein
VSHGLFLDDAELRELTGFARAAEREAWLREKGIPFRLDGRRFIVLRQHVVAWVENRPVVSSNSPNWSALERA